MPNPKEKPIEGTHEVEQSRQHIDDEERGILRDTPPTDTAETPQARARDATITIGLFAGAEFNPDMLETKDTENLNPTVHLPEIPIERLVDIPHAAEIPDMPDVAEPLEENAPTVSLDKTADECIEDNLLEYENQNDLRRSTPVPTARSDTAVTAVDNHKNNHKHNNNTNNETRLEGGGCEEVARTSNEMATEKDMIRDSCTMNQSNLRSRSSKLIRGLHEDFDTDNDPDNNGNTPIYSIIQEDRIPLRIRRLPLQSNDDTKRNHETEEFIIGSTEDRETKEVCKNQTLEKEDT